ncbi:MAG TPA: zonular occludens toxin domain-containing protein [Candidatus Nanoarchaeia archaeon]|nr:zonular occludens toxin domain-containing protein [Candidatus Nanoarchaeia archaeon]
MAKKKKSSKNYLALGIKYFFQGIYWLIKNVVLGIYFVIRFFYNEIKNIKFNRQTKVVKEENRASERKEITNRPNVSGSGIYADFFVLKEIHGNFSSFEDYLLKTNSGIGIIIGARGTGKSALGLKLLENIHVKTGRKVSTMGFNSEDLPNWVNNIETIEEVKNNSVVLLDESGITFSSRESMSNINKLLSNLLLIARHKDVTLIFISQNSSNIDLNIIRQADFLLFKPSSLLQKDFERKKINDIYKEVDNYFKEYKGEKGLVYVYSDVFKGFVLNPLPSFWNDKVSKAYRDN